MTLTLRTRLAVASTVTFGLLVAGISVVTYRVLASRLDADVTQRLLALSDGLHGFLRFDGEGVSTSFDPADGDQARFVHQATQYYQVYDAETGRLFAESAGMAPLGLQLTPVEVRGFAARQGLFDVETDYGRFRFASSIEKRADGRADLLQVGVSLAELDGLLGRYRTVLLWRTPAILLVAVLAFWYLAGFALLPLARVEAAAHRIDLGTLGQRLPVRGVGDELDAVAGAFNQTLDRLAKAVGDMRQFGGALAHELRTPLAALRGQIELSLQAKGIAEDQREALASQIDEIDRLTRLIDRVLTLARAEAGQVQLTFGTVNLADLARSLVEQLEPLAEARGIALRAGRLDVVEVEGDAGWLQRLLLNLLDNALKYTPPDGHIEVRVARVGDAAAIAVTDSGVGLSPEDAQRVFEKFFRADASRSSESAGAGLGLSLVEWIATQHQGRVSVDSRLGQGSTFTVTLPLDRRPAVEPSRD